MHWEKGVLWAMTILLYTTDSYSVWCTMVVRVCSGRAHVRAPYALKRTRARASLFIPSARKGIWFAANSLRANENMRSIRWASRTTLFLLIHHFRCSTISFEFHLGHSYYFFPLLFFRLVDTASYRISVMRFTAYHYEPVASSHTNMKK